MKQKYRGLGILLCLIGLVSLGVYGDVDSLIERLNQEVEELYQVPDYFRIEAENRPFNYKVYKDYNLPVYGIPHIIKDNTPGNDIKNGEYRFIGYNNHGESVPNPKFPADHLSDRDFTTMNGYNDPSSYNEITDNPKFKSVNKT